MQTFRGLSVAVLMAGLSALPSVAGEAPTAGLEEQARALVAEFEGALKPQLKQALADGGPVRAIEVCAAEAPAIADTLSARSGWRVGRVSLKSRNASRAVPDRWQRQVLEGFDRREAAGELPGNINYAEIVGGQYRYMQAQGVEGVCLLCHGQSLAENVTQALELYYPDDLATGYGPGQVRGAISLSRGL